MADEQETIAESGQEAATEDVVETEGLDTETQEATGQENDEEAEGDDVDGDEAEETEGEESDLADLEFAFGKYRVPKKLRDDVLNLQKTFTQKTQEYSQGQQALDARKAEIEQQAKVTEEERAEIAEQFHVNQTLEQYKAMSNADWQQLERTDPLGAQTHWRQFQSLQNRSVELSKSIEERQQQKSQEAQQDFAKRVEETKKFATENIKGWGPELDRQIAAFAQEQGISQDFIQRNMSPTTYNLMHLAMVGKQLLTKQAKPKSAAQQPTKPLKTVASKSNPKPKGLHDDLSPEEWARRRNEQLRKRA